MKPDHIFLALTVASFLASCIFYRKAHDAAGDRLLFLAYTMLLSGWLTMFDRWGVLIRK
jgi:hypothetical protein